MEKELVHTAVLLCNFQSSMSLGGSAKRRDLGIRSTWTQVLGLTLPSYVTFFCDPVLVWFCFHRLYTSYLWAVVRIT